MTECKYCDCVLPVSRHITPESFKTVRMESTKQIDDQFADILIVKCVGYDCNGAYLDVVKHNVSKRLDESTDSSNTFIDDLVSAIIASAESKVAQTLTIDTRI